MKKLINTIKENTSQIGIILGYIVIPVLIGVSLAVCASAIVNYGWKGVPFLIAPIGEFIGTYFFTWRHLADNSEER